MRKTEAGMHPVQRLLEWFPESDFGVLEHGWAVHGRDYLVIAQTPFGPSAGTYELRFTHVVRCVFESRVRDDVWPESWAEEFTDYQTWIEAGEPAGYVWGTNWSNAYPGLAAIPDSAPAVSWSERIGRPMFEATLETDRFEMKVIFHELRSEKLNDDVGTISQVHFPLKSR